MIKLLRTTLVAILAAVLSAGCANLGQWDPVFGGNASLLYGVPPERMGKLFGSIAIAFEDKAIEGLGITLYSPSTGKTADIDASTRVLVTTRRENIDTGSERVWVFYGQLPAGDYSIVNVRLDFVAHGRTFPRVNLRPSVPITVTTDRLTYLGRWTVQEQGRPMRAWHAGAVVWEGDFRTLLRSALEQDRAALETLRQQQRNWPAPPDAVFNPFKALDAPQRALQGS